MAKSNQWQNQVKLQFPSQTQWEALNILGLFILNRFRKLSYEEVIEMLNFDLMDTVAGKQLYNMGIRKGEANVEKKALKALRDTILDILNARFEVIPQQLATKIRGIKQMKKLKDLMIQASLCSDIESFKEKLSSP